MNFRIFVIFFLCSMSASASAALSTPNVSANGLFLYRNSNFSQADQDTTRNGLDLREAEIAFNADVDPYSRLNLTLSVQPEYSLDSTSNKVSQDWKIEPEEAFAEITHIPSTIVKIGKFKAAMGKHNQLHTHTYPFVDVALANSELLGEEGLNSTGLSAAVLLPVGWFSEVTGQALRGDGENVEFNSPTPGDVVALGRWKNLWDISDSLTAELGGSYARGANSVGGYTTLGGVDWTLKWRPISGGKYRSWIFAGELLRRRLEQGESSVENGLGWNAWAQYQFAERWALASRFDKLRVAGSNKSLNPNSLENRTSKKYSASLIFWATEFSSFRLEYDQSEGPVKNDQSVERKVYLQANFTIGAHPAHSY